MGAKGDDKFELLAVVKVADSVGLGLVVGGVDGAGRTALALGGVTTAGGEKLLHGYGVATSWCCLVGEAIGFTAASQPWYQLRFG